MTCRGTFGDIEMAQLAAGPIPLRRPLLSSDSVFSARVLCGLLSWADERSIPPDKLIPGLGERDQRITFSYQSIQLGFARAQHLHGSTDLARLTGSHKTVNHLGPLGPAQLAHATLGDAKKFGMRNQASAGSLLRMSLVVGQESAAFECHQLFEDDECGTMIDVDHMIAAFNVMTAFCRAPLPVERIELRGTDEQFVGPLQRMLRTPVHLGRPVSRLVIKAALLDTPNPNFDEMTWRFWSQICEKETSEVGSEKTVTLRHLLQSYGPMQGLDRLAEHLHVSRRTVHRMLAREGIDYSEFVDRHRRVRAELLLKRGESADAIAAVLGFSDGRSFRRAFRRWTGLSPNDFRHYAVAGGQPIAS